MKKILITALFFGIISIAKTQEVAPSPSSEVKQRVGLTDITINYSRPGVKGRTIFGKNGLVSFGKLWRTGANAATKFTFSNDIKIGGQELKSGSYTILTKPESSNWEVNFYPYDGSRWSSYQDKTPAVTLSTKVISTENLTETFLITINDIRNTSASLNMIWEKTMVSIPIEVK